METREFRTDGVSLGILHSRFVAVAESMCHTLERTAYSTFIKESADYACGLLSPEGEIFAYPRNLGVTSFVGLNAATAIRNTGGFGRGDVIITNDPYSTDGLANHLPDIHMFAPIFVDDTLLAFAWCFIHSSDVGGEVPGSISPDLRTIAQEGFRIPPTKLVEAGRLNDVFLSEFMAASRIPEDNWGDLKAMMAALGTGERQLRDLVIRYSIETVRDAADDVLLWSQRGMEEVISSIPDGSYSFVDYLDGDENGHPVRLEVRLEINGPRAVFDFHGTDPQVGNAFNLPAFGPRHPFLNQAMLNFVLTHHPDIPMTGGLMRPLLNLTEPGSIVCPSFPAAVGVRYATAHRIYNVVMGALAQAAPDLVPSAGAGQAAIVALSVPREDGSGRTVTVLEPMFGGGGATRSSDGIAGADSCAGYLKNTPVESIERASPVIVHAYGLTPGSGGPGERRGGWGVEFEFEVLSDDAIVTARGMERTRFRPWGFAGGKSASLTSASVLRAGKEEALEGRIGVLALGRGDRVRIRASGAGGLGEPFCREPESVAADVRVGLLRVDEARTQYGVVIREDLSVDYDESDRLRAGPRTSAQQFDFGPERERLDESWPPSARELLRRVFAQVDPVQWQSVKDRAFRLVAERGTPLREADVAGVSEWKGS